MREKDENFSRKWQITCTEKSSQKSKTKARTRENKQNKTKQENEIKNVIPSRE